MLDLQVHSYYSDGIYSPKELAREAKKLGIKIISLTDHNGTAGVEEMNFECKKVGIKNIPGVEIYTQFKGHQLNILGYNFDYKNKKLNNVLAKLQKDKIPIIKKCLTILEKDNWEIAEKKVFSSPAVYIGVDKPARMLMQNKKNLIRIKKDFNFQPKNIMPISEIIGKYFFKDNQPICPETKIDTLEAIKLIHQAKGKAVLAHPGQQISWDDAEIIYELKKGGLDGLEAISAHHGWKEIEHWQIVAKKLKLFITAGSDFHGYVPKEWNFTARGPWDYFKTTNFSIRKLTRFLNE